MFWKNVKSYWQSLSLRTQLMALYTLSTLALLSIIGLFLYPTFNKIISQLNGSEAANITVECFKKIIIILLVGALFALWLGQFVAKRALNKMQISLTKLSQFSADIAHELRNPLHQLRIATEVVLMEEPLPLTQRQLLESHLEEYQQLSKLVESLLFLARADNGQLVLEKKLLDVNREISKIADYYQALIDEKNITFRCEGEVELLADLVLFKRIISNLLSNALRHTPSHGNVTITLKPHLIAIQDSGEGIAKEHLPKIFDRFYRADVARTTHISGLGLGLSIVKSIVDLHRWKIKIESMPQTGTTVYILV